MAPDFKKHLERQIGFLRLSWKATTPGTHESVRIAAITRVLIHDNKKLQLLAFLKHLWRNEY